jgi:hypothetical protein
LSKSLTSERALPPSHPDGVRYVFPVKSIAIRDYNRVGHDFEADGAFNCAVEVVFEELVELFLGVFHEGYFFHSGLFG